MKAEIKQLLIDFYADEALLSLLQSWGQRLAQWFQEQVLSLLIDQEPANG